MSKLPPEVRAQQAGLDAVDAAMEPKPGAGCADCGGPIYRHTSWWCPKCQPFDAKQRIMADEIERLRAIIEKTCIGLKGRQYDPQFMDRMAAECEKALEAKK